MQHSQLGQMYTCQKLSLSLLILCSRHSLWELLRGIRDNWEEQKLKVFNDRSKCLELSNLVPGAVFGRLVLGNSRLSPQPSTPPEHFLHALSCSFTEMWMTLERQSPVSGLAHTRHDCVIFHMDGFKYCKLHRTRLSMPFSVLVSLPLPDTFFLFLFTAIPGAQPPNLSHLAHSHI